MKILALSDVHCDWDKFNVRDMPEADCAVVAGDLTDWGLRHEQGHVVKSQKFMDDLAGKYGHVFWIPGNHELDIKPDYYDASYDEEEGEWPWQITGIYHRKAYIYGVFPDGIYKRSFQGVSCSPCYDMPQLAEMWDYMTADPAKEKAVYTSLEPCDVLVSHCPPYGYLDNAGYIIGRGGAHIGSKELLDYIEREQPMLVICGHVHGDGGKECMIGKTRVVNTAQRWKVLEV